MYHIIGTNYRSGNFKWSRKRGLNKVSINADIQVFCNIELISILNTKWLKTFCVTSTFIDITQPKFFHRPHKIPNKVSSDLLFKFWLNSRT